MMLKTIAIIIVSAVLLTMTFMKLSEFFILKRALKETGRLPLPGEYNMMKNPWACRWKVFGVFFQACIYGGLAYFIGRYGLAWKLLEEGSVG